MLPDNVTEYLTDRDVDRLVWGISQARGIFASAPIAANPSDEVYPGPSLASDGKDLRAWVRSTVYIYSHWIGTARMGNDAEGCTQDCDAASLNSSVLDPTLRVRGTPNLFVADASVMPYISNGNVHSSVAMIAYRAADIISGGKNDNS